MTELTIHKCIFIGAPKETVWQYLTDKDKLATWFHPAEQNLQQGEGYQLMKAGEGNAVKAIIWGRVLEMVENEKLVTTFVIEPFGGIETTVHWQLESVSCGTRLTLIHEGVEAAAGAAATALLLALDAGWDEHFADLRKLG